MADARIVLLMHVDGKRASVFVGQLAVEPPACRHLLDSALVNTMRLGQAPLRGQPDDLERTDLILQRIVYLYIVMLVPKLGPHNVVVDVRARLVQAVASPAYSDFDVRLIGVQSV